MQIEIKEKKIDDGKFGFFGPSALLLNPFSKILLGVMLAALLGTLGFSVFKVFEVKDLKIALLKEQQTNQHLSSELGSCHAEVDDMNRQLIEIAADAERDISVIEKVNEELNKLTVEQGKEIIRLRNIPAPKDCEGSRDWLKQNITIFERE